jgi:hypothetical protein
MSSQEDFPNLLEDSSIHHEDSFILQEDSLSSLGDSSILTEEISDLDDTSIQDVVEADNRKEKVKVKQMKMNKEILNQLTVKLTEDPKDIPQ